MPFSRPGTASHDALNGQSRPNTASTIDSNYSCFSNGVSSETPSGFPMQNQQVNGVLRQQNAQNADPPNATSRKSRNGGPQVLEVAQDPSRMRSLSRRRIQNQSTDEESHASGHHGYTGVPLKRNMSGTMSTNSSTTSIDAQAAPRRSRRLFTQIRPNITKTAPPPTIGLLNPKESLEPKKIKATGTRGRSATQSTVGRVVSGNRKPMESSENILKESRSQPPVYLEPPPVQAPPSHNVDRSRQYDALQWLLDLFCRLGQGYNCLSAFENLEAIRQFNLLPQQQKDTPWVLAQIGKAYLEQTNYVESEKHFARLRKLAPSRLEDMEIYSTVLWHLKHDTELTYLAHELMDLDRLSPEAWCAIGNSFSLHREHDQALKCFKRATQLNPKFSYAFTLQGHEHISNEDYEKALQAYRRALATDGRHYNGWYGLGKVYEKLGKHEIAEKHYRAAASINPTNSVLVCCMGVVSCAPPCTFSHTHHHIRSSKR